MDKETPQQEALSPILTEEIDTHVHTFRLNLYYIDNAWVNFFSETV